MHNFYQSKYTLIKGKTNAAKMAHARAVYNTYTRSTKRRPYIKSAYFGRRKVFLSLFWEHIAQKRYGERYVRIAFYDCALDLIKNSRLAPDTTIDVFKRETLYRFYGKSKDGRAFAVQVKRNYTDERHHMSVFPL